MMAVLDYLFGFGGRIGRGPYWLSFPLPALLYPSSYALLGITHYTISTRAPFFERLLAHTAGATALVLSIGLLLGSMYSGASVATKRLHDRGRGVVWLVPFSMLPHLLWIGLQVSMTLAYPKPWSVTVGSALLLFSGPLGYLVLVVTALRALASPPAYPGGEIVADVLALLMIALVAWSFVELACKQGQSGRNRYGSDPRAEPEAEILETFR